MLIPKKISQVSELATLVTDASATVSTGGGNAMNFTGLVISRRGAPNKVLKIDALWQSVLGKPYHMSQGANAECLRHVDDAVKGGNGYVVRVLPATARYPVVTLRDVVEGEDLEKATYNTASTDVQAITTDEDAATGFEWVKTGLPYGVGLVSNEAADIVSFYLVDGDNENDKKLSLKKASESEYGAGFYHLMVSETLPNGVITLTDDHLVSFDPEAIDNQGQPAFISDVLEGNTQRLRAKVDLNRTADISEFEAVSFTHGTSGKMSEIVSADYDKAIEVLRKEDPDFHAVCALGCYDDNALQALKELAVDARVSLYYDIEPNLSYAKALERQVALAMSSHHASAYHLPYTATDPFYSSAINWGLSGFVFAAKAAGVASAVPVGAWHLVPAGMDRATITRPNLVINENAGVPDYDAMVKARLNKVGLNRQGQLMIDDSLTCRAKSDYLRFENQVSVDNALQREWYKLALQFKHEPDDVVRRGLTEGFERILQDFETSKCLVKPRDPKDGDRPWRFELRQAEVDLWVADWWVCISGSMRRGTGQCHLLR